MQASNAREKFKVCFAVHCPNARPAQWLVWQQISNAYLALTGQVDVSDSEDYSDYDDEEFSDEGDDFDDGDEDYDDQMVGAGAGAGSQSGKGGRYRGPVPDEFLYRMFAHMFNRELCHLLPGDVYCLWSLPARTDADGDPCECPNCRARGGARPGFRPGYKPK